MSKASREVANLIKRKIFTPKYLDFNLDLMKENDPGYYKHNLFQDMQNVHITGYQTSPLRSLPSHALLTT